MERGIDRADGFCGGKASDHFGERERERLAQALGAIGRRPVHDHVGPLAYPHPLLSVRLRSETAVCSSHLDMETGLVEHPQPRLASDGRARGPTAHAM
jgi:hypothetical protein